MTRNLAHQNYNGQIYLRIIRVYGNFNENSPRTATKCRMSFDDEWKIV